MCFDELDKILFIIDNGLVGSIIKNSPKNNSKELKFKLLVKRIDGKIDQVLIKPLKLMFKKPNIYIESNKNWLIYESINNLNALKPIEKDKNIFIKPNKDIIYKYLIFYKIFYAVPLAFYLIKKNKIRWYFMYYDHLGVIEESERLIKKHKPLKLIFANDINPYQVALKIAAKQQNIPTYYFQHASISYYMHPLDFDVAFLEGQASLDKYKEIGIVSANVELIGMMKYQKSNIKHNTNKKVRSIGITLNILDDLSITENLIYNLNEKFPLLDIYLRMHPRDNRNINMKGIDIFFSDSKKEGIFQFLNNIDLLIAGNTSTHLEAALVNVVPIFHNLSDNGLRDPYGYIKNGLVFHAKNKNDLYKYIEKQIISKSDVLKKTTYYNEYIRNKVDYKVILDKYGI